MSRCSNPDSVAVLDTIQRDRPPSPMMASALEEKRGTAVVLHEAAAATLAASARAYLHAFKKLLTKREKTAPAALIA